MGLNVVNGIFYDIYICLCSLLEEHLSLLHFHFLLLVHILCYPETFLNFVYVALGSGEYHAIVIRYNLYILAKEFQLQSICTYIGDIVRVCEGEGSLRVYLYWSKYDKWLTQRR